VSIDKILLYFGLCVFMMIDECLSYTGKTLRLILSNIVIWLILVDIMETNVRLHILGVNK
jgi:hypothetical protein